MAPLENKKTTKQSTIGKFIMDNLMNNIASDASTQIQCAFEAQSPAGMKHKSALRCGLD
jgi:hypothetical protein